MHLHAVLRAPVLLQEVSNHAWRALQNIRVIDFTHALAGPFCVMLLGHLGPSIISRSSRPTAMSFAACGSQPGATNDACEVLVDKRQQEKHRA